MKGHARSRTVQRKKFADTPAVPNHYKFICVNESDPLKNSDASENAVLFGCRGYREIWSVIEERRDAAIDVGL
jgi:hypothetical protein